MMITSDGEISINDDHDDITILEDLQLPDGNLVPLGSPPDFKFFSEGVAGSVGAEITAGSNVALKTAYDHVRQQNEHCRKHIKSLLEKNKQLKVLAKATTPRILFHAASASGDVEQIHELLESGIDVNDCLFERKTALYIAAANAKTNVSSLLLHAKADPNAVDNDGSGPLHIACRNGCVEICKLLIEFGADLNASDRDGSGPLHIACRNGCVEICKLLIEFGADLNASDRDGRTPLHIATANRHPDTCTLLIESRKMDMEAVIDVNAVDIYGQTPLLMAKQNHHDDVFNILQDAGAVLPPIVDDHHIRDRSDGNNPAAEDSLVKQQLLQKQLLRIVSLLVNAGEVSIELPDLKDRIDQLCTTSQEMDESPELHELQSIEHTLKDAIDLKEWPKTTNSGAVSDQIKKAQLTQQLNMAQAETMQVKHQLEQECNERKALERLLSEAENVDLYSATNVEDDNEMYDIGRLFSKVAFLERNSKDLYGLVQDQAHRITVPGGRLLLRQHIRQGSSSLPVSQRNQERASDSVRQSSSLQNESATSRNYLHMHDIRLPPVDLESPQPVVRDCQVGPSHRVILPQGQAQPMRFQNTQRISPPDRPRHGSTGKIPPSPSRHQMFENTRQPGPGSWPYEHQSTTTADPRKLSQSDPTKIQDSSTASRQTARRTPGFVPRSTSHEIQHQPFQSVMGPPASDYSSQNQRSRYVEGASQPHIVEDHIHTSPRWNGDESSHQRYAMLPTGENSYPVSCSDERQIIGSRDQIAIPGARDPQENMWTDIPGFSRDELVTGQEQIGHRQELDQLGQSAVVAQQQQSRESSPPKMECPVCKHQFNVGTPEQTVNAHVNSHFDEGTNDPGEFEILA